MGILVEEVEQLIPVHWTLYVRLIGYPFLALSLIVLAFGGQKGRSANSYLFHVLMSVFFLMLWGSTVIAILTGDNQVVVSYNNYTLTPVLIIIIACCWKTILKELYNKEKEI